VTWAGTQLALGSQRFGPSHVAAMIYPNPLNPKRYIVLNSGTTQRAGDHGTNSRQVPRLPDYAIIDTTTPPNERVAGKIVAAGFFDENWQLK
jgi:hypothetical protein